MFAYKHVHIIHADTVIRCMVYVRDNDNNRSEDPILQAV